MSGRACALVAALRNVSPTEKLVLMILASYAHADTLEAWPSQATIAADSGLSERAVRKALSELQKRGVICREARRRRNGSRSSDIVKIVAQQAPRAGSEQPAPRSAPTRHHVPPQNRNSEPEKVISDLGPSGPSPEKPSLPPTDLFGRSEPEPKVAKAAKPVLSITEAEAFARWWGVYPLKVKRPVAQIAFRKALGGMKGELADKVALLMTGAQRVAEVAKNPREARYIRHPSTWLNQEGWADEDSRPTLNEYGLQFDPHRPPL